MITDQCDLEADKGGSGSPGQDLLVSVPEDHLAMDLKVAWLTV